MFTCLRECVIDSAEWLGSDSEDDSSGSDDDDDDDADKGSKNGESHESEGEDDGVAPDQDVEMVEEVPVADLKLSDAEQAALDAKRAAEEASMDFFLPGRAGSRLC